MRRHSPRLEHLRSLIACAALLCESGAHADGVIAKRGQIVARSPRCADANCAETPHVRSLHLLRTLTGLSFGVVTTVVGATRRGIDGGVTIDLVSVRYPLGGGDIGKIQAQHGQDSRARLRFTLLNVPAVFSCRDGSGSLHPPVTGHLLIACGAGARLGVGALVGELSWDPVQRRRTARWADVGGVVNLLGATTSMAYLRGHLDASVRFGVDSVWHGHGETRMGSDHMARSGVALDGAIRSANGRWEATIQVSVRSTVFGTVAAFRDFGWTAEASGFYNVLVDSTAMSFGIEVRSAQWSDPSTSIGALDATNGSPAVFAGAALRVRRESKP